MASIFFSSDHHFGHANIIKYCNRDFQDVHQMNVEMARRWNEVVNHDDLVYYLGDFSLQLRSAEWWASQLNGKKILVCGNHDKCWPHRSKKKVVPFEDYINIGFEEVCTEKIIKIPLNEKLTEIKLHHMPYASTSGEAVDMRYLQHRPKDEGHLLFHGHVHTSFLLGADKRHFNVGVDMHNLYPWSLKEIDQLLRDNGYYDITRGYSRRVLNRSS